MMTIIKKWTNQLVKSPKTLFLIDGLGALLTAFLLFVILKNFNEYVGVPQNILTYLSIIPMIFCVYSLTCFFFLKENWTPFIRAIGIANLSYCLVTMILLIVYYTFLTPLGITYFLLELLIICVLVYIELSVATRIQQQIKN